MQAGIQPGDLQIIPARNGEGYVYIAAFASGVVKVGQSVSPRERISNYHRHTIIHGDRIAECWVSPPHAHAEVRSAERALIEFCRLRGTTEVGIEYFSGVDFADVRAHAETLSMARAPAKSPEDQTVSVDSSHFWDFATNLIRRWRLGLLVDVKEDPAQPIVASEIQAMAAAAAASDDELRAAQRWRQRQDWLQRKRDRTELRDDERAHLRVLHGR